MLAALLAALSFFGPVSSEAACGQSASRVAVSSFVQSFNRGNTARLNRLFAVRGEFGWYSSGAPGRRVRAAAYRRDTLLRYFAGRHRQADRLRLLTFRFNGSGSFEFRMRRSAKDFRGGRAFQLQGKGAVSCFSGRIVVMSLSGPLR